MDQSNSHAAQSPSFMTATPGVGWENALSLGLSAGVLLGGIVGLVISPFISGAISTTITVFACMAVAALAGGLISVMRAFSNRSVD